MKRLVYSFGALLIGAAATMGCTEETTGNTGGNGGTGNSNGGQGGTGADGGGGSGAQGGGGNMMTGASVTFENATYSSTENEDGSVTVNVVLGMPAGEVLDAALTVGIEAGGASTATIGEDVVDPGAFEVTFAAGSGDGTLASFTVTPLADVDREGDEDLILAFATSATATTGDDATLTITDDDALLIGHSRFISGGAVAVNMGVDVHDPGTSLTKVGDQAIGFIAVEGAAYDETADVLYVVSDATQDMLGMVDPATGELTQIGSIGFYEVECLAFDPTAGVLYGVDDATNTLLEIDTSTGRGTAVGALNGLGFSLVQGCAFDSTNNVLYGVHRTTNTLITIDTTTGVGTSVGNGSADFIEGLAYDPNADKLFGSNDDDDTRQLVEVNRTDGTTTVVGSLDDQAAEIQALAFDSTANVLYGADVALRSLVEIADDTGEVTHLSALGVLGVDALAYDDTNGILYGVANNFGDGSALVSWDKTNGKLKSETILADTAFILGLAYGNNTLFAYDDVSQEMVTIDPATGELTYLGDPGQQFTALDYGNGTLYASTGNQLFTVDVATATLVGTYDDLVTSVEGMAYDAANSVLYVIEDFNGTGSFFLSSVDPSNADATPIGTIEMASRSIYGLAHDGTALYGVDDARAALTRIDTTDARVTLVASQAVVPDGMAFDPGANTVYISEEDFNWLWAYDLTTSNTTLVGLMEDNVGDLFVPGLAFDPTTNTLFGADELNELVTIDTATGFITVVGEFDLTSDVQGLAWDDATSTLYAASVTDIYTVNRVDASQTAIGSFANHDDVRGLAWDPIGGRLIGVDNGLDSGEAPEAITINTTTGESTTLRTLGRGDCSGTVNNCNLAKAAAFAY